jgi:hypothetical protein
MLDADVFRKEGRQMPAFLFFSPDSLALCLTVQFDQIEA